MFGWIARLFFVIAGFIASWFIARTELHFPIIQMVIAVLLFTFFVGVVAFWPIIRDWFKRLLK